MDIAKVSMAISSAKTASDVSIAVLDKVMDTMKIEGEMITDMMQALSVPIDNTLGSNVDIRV